MNRSEIDVKQFRGPLEESLAVYEHMIDRGFRFGNYEDFVLTPNKPNSARTVVPVDYRGREVGKMHVIAFSRGDGMGDDKIYKREEIEVSERMRYKVMPERVFPRPKLGVYAEGFFPLFSIAGGKNVAPFAARLEELTFGSRKVVQSRLGLGQEREGYLRLLELKEEAEPRIKLTTGADSSGHRFGDSHAIYYEPEL